MQKSHAMKKPVWMGSRVVRSAKIWTWHFTSESSCLNSTLNSQGKTLLVKLHRALPGRQGDSFAKALIWSTRLMPR